MNFCSSCLPSRVLSLQECTTELGVKFRASCKLGTTFYQPATSSAYIVGVLTLFHEDPVKELEEKVPQSTRFVFQEAHRDIKVLDRLILDGGRWVQRRIMRSRQNVQAPRHWWKMGGREAFKSQRECLLKVFRVQTHSSLSRFYVSTDGLGCSCKTKSCRVPCGLLDHTQASWTVFQGSIILLLYGSPYCCLQTLTPKTFRSFLGQAKLLTVSGFALVPGPKGPSAEAI